MRRSARNMASVRIERAADEDAHAAQDRGGAQGDRAPRGKLLRRAGAFKITGALYEWLADLFWHLMVDDSRVPPSQAELTST